MLVSTCAFANSKHFIKDNQYRRIVQNDFEKRKNSLKHSNAFNIFETRMTTEEREAMEFLYAYSPLSDIMIHDGNFWLKNVKVSFATRNSVSWGETIPEEIFRHFVLPLRSNNESLDSARIVFTKELMPRIKGCKSMSEAALEVNHWCHEKANYQPTDARTAGPMAIIKRTYGRCGEESVFAVAALRAAGIPARQIYTPRWAHCDDNHAWVEVWADGKWKFLGACEPEPALNMAWFTFPASRGLFMQCKVFGKYKGSEELVHQYPLIALINTTSTYTKICTPIIEVRDKQGNIVSDAIVEYKIYNYAEYCTVASLSTDKKGTVCLGIGEGDWIIWASKNNEFGFIVVNPTGKKKLTIILNKPYNAMIDSLFNIVPPPGEEININVSETQRVQNDARLAAEDSIRNNFSKSFVKEDPLLQNTDFLAMSYGNYGQVIRFMEQVNEKKPCLLPTARLLLGAITTKDLQDIDSDVLLSHLLEWSNFTGKQSCNAFTAANVISPRISTEVLTGWRPCLQTWLKREKIIYRGTGYEKESAKLIRNAMENIITDESTGRGDVLMTPESVAKSMITDSKSKDLFFVAACRTAGIPARLNPVDGKPQYFYYRDTTCRVPGEEGEWETVSFATGNNDADKSLNTKGLLKITCSGGAIKNPLYYINFTISRIENGRAELLDLGNSSEGDMGPGMRCDAIFRNPIELQTGEYILVTGNRRTDGSVVSQIKSFSILKDQTTNMNISIPLAEDNFKVIGKIDLKKAKIQLQPGINKILIVFMDSSEPSIHLKRDLAAVQGEMDNHKNAMQLIGTNISATEEAAIISSLAEDLKIKAPKNLPLVIVSDKEGNVLFLSQGYKIGTGYQILKYL